VPSVSISSAIFLIGVGDDWLCKSSFYVDIVRIAAMPDADAPFFILMLKGHSCSKSLSFFFAAASFSKLKISFVLCAARRCDVDVASYATPVTGHTGEDKVVVHDVMRESMRYSIV
jgi:hypothetical protein